MAKTVKSILLLSALLLLAFNAPLSAQTGTIEVEPPELPQLEAIQEDTPVAEPQPDMPPVLTESPETEPPQPAVIQHDTPAPPKTPQIEVIQRDTPVAEPQPQFVEQAGIELSEPTPFFEPERPKTKTRTAVPPHSSAFVFPAGLISCNIRGGYRKYDGVDEYQHVRRKSMFTYGGMAGKRFALKNAKVRFQAALEAGWGSKEEDSYDYEGDNTSEDAHEYINFSTFGIQTDMHILFPDKRRAYFLSLGPGLHRSSFYFSLKGKGNQVLWKGENMSTVSPSFNIGAGMEHTLNKYRALSLAYNFRIWNPVSYTETGDLFPMGVQYEEFFYSHTLQILILLPGTKKGRFFP